MIKINKKEIFDDLNYISSILKEDYEHGNNKALQGLYKLSHIQNALSNLHLMQDGFKCPYCDTKLIVSAGMNCTTCHRYVGGKFKKEYMEID